MKTVEERFWSKVDKTSNPNGCWQWIGAKNQKGYGLILINYKTILAHRYCYELHKGFISNELHVCHKCDNPSCINPDHLFLGTAQNNMSDKVAKGRQSKGSNRWNSKLTEEQVLDIRTKELSCKEYMKKYGISNQRIYQIWNNKSWTHI